MRVREYIIKERASITSSGSFAPLGNVLQKTYSGDVPRSPNTTPRLWNASLKTKTNENFCKEEQSMSADRCASMTRSQTLVWANKDRKKKGKEHSS